MDHQKQIAKTSTITLTKEKAAVILTLFIFCLVSVGLLAGLVKPTCKSPTKQPLPGSSSPQTDASTATELAEPWKNHRLPRHLVPLHYDLTLHPDFYGPDGGPGTFSGQVAIWIKVTQRATRHFLIHVKKLQVGSVSCWRRAALGGGGGGGGEERTLMSIRAFPYEPNEYLVIELTATEVQPNTTVVIELEFVGSLTSGITGIYRSAYTDDATNQTKSV